MVGPGVLAASRMRLPGAKGASTAKGLRCQCQASRRQVMHTRPPREVP